MKIELREYVDTDYNELIGMVSALYNEDPEGQPINSSKVEATINEYKENSQKIKIIIILKNSYIIGYSLLVYFWSNEYGGNILFIDELYIKKEFRNKGIGSYFLKYVENMDDINAIQLETTPSNKRVYKYYKKMGFEDIENKHLIKIKDL